jgi:hypothetical protein
MWVIAHRADVLHIGIVRERVVPFQENYWASRGLERASKKRPWDGEWPVHENAGTGGEKSGEPKKLGERPVCPRFILPVYSFWSI